MLKSGKEDQYLSITPQDIAYKDGVGVIRIYPAFIV